MWLLSINSLVHMQRREQAMSLMAELNVAGAENDGSKSDEKSHTKS